MKREKKREKKGFFMKRPGVFGNAVVLPLVFLVFIFAFIQCDNGTTSIYEGKTVVCLGDSLTAGHGATIPGLVDRSKSYPAYLQNKVNIPVINAGVSGNTTTQGLFRVDAEVLSQNPQIIIINLGANDFFQRIPVTTTRDNLQNIINKVNDGNRKIYLAKFYTKAIAMELFDSFGVTDYDFQTVLDQYDDLFDTLVSENNVTLIEDIWSGVWGIYMSDLVHPNAKGYEIMADNIFNVLQPYLRANDLLK